jgi:hypothetical protein
MDPQWSRAIAPGRPMARRSHRVRYFRRDASASDRSHPAYPIVHTVLPVPSQGAAYVNSEDTSYGKGAAHFDGIVDIRNPAQPQLISLFPHPSPAMACHTEV